MQNQVINLRNLQSAVIIISVGFLCGLIYPLFGDEITDGVAFINGMEIGLLGGISISFFEYVVFRINSRRWSFISLVALKTIIYFVIFAVLIVSIICFNRGHEHGMTFMEYFNSSEFQTFIWQGDFKVILIYCLVLLTVINFTRQINRKIGYGVLLNYILGRYHQPKEEERIFAFIDLKKSTEIAERLDARQFHQFLYEFFHDVSLGILITHGEIYRYVGDEIVISWKTSSITKNTNCIRSYFLMKQDLENSSQKYKSQFGFVPEYYAAFHVGKVITGEMGDVKSQFVFHGETLFVTSEIEEACKESGYDLLISSDLMSMIKLPDDLQTIPIGKSVRDLDLYTIEAC